MIEESQRILEIINDPESPKKILCSIGYYDGTLEAIVQEILTHLN